MQFVYNESGEMLDKTGKPIKEGANTAIQEPDMKSEMYYLLHWGLETSITYDNEHNPIPYTSTVAICQHIQTGHIQTFQPSSIKVIGVEHKK